MLNISRTWGNWCWYISAIPTDAIERVEIFAVMVHLLNTVLMCDGVMNIILKKSTNGGSENGEVTLKWRENDWVSLNNGSTVGDKGYINYTVDFQKLILQTDLEL
jgi:iron complex outermembrane receptor protein